MTRRVVITGMGLLSALGNNVKDSWEGICRGEIGSGLITRFDTTNYLAKYAAELKGFDPLEFMSSKEIRRLDPYQQFLIAAARMAISDGGVQVTPEESGRISVVIGSAVGGLSTYGESMVELEKTEEPRKVSPFGVPMFIANGGSDMIGIEIGAGGPSATLMSACATGADCIGYGLDLIRLNRVDRVVAGAAEYPVVPIGVAGFDRIKTIARDGIVRPFDKNRTGMIFGEGAGVLVLEELEYAKNRGANILAEIVGYGSSVDGFHITAPDPDGFGGSRAIEMALDEAQLNPEDIDYINAHGTGTELNDTMETNAVKRVFGNHAYEIPMSSTKSMTGHAMGATAAVEAVLSVMTLQTQFVPGTMNYETPDPACDLDYVPNEGREMLVKTVMSNSFGFGGHNASLIFRKFDD